MELELRTLRLAFDAVSTALYIVGSQGCQVDFEFRLSNFDESAKSLWHHAPYQ